MPRDRPGRCGAAPGLGADHWDNSSAKSSKLIGVVPGETILPWAGEPLVFQLASWMVRSSKLTTPSPVRSLTGPLGPAENWIAWILKFRIGDVFELVDDVFLVDDLAFVFYIGCIE